jgi:hypothetical protein
MNISLSSLGRCAWTVLISALSCGLTPALVEAGSFPATIDLHNLRSIGFRIDGRIPGEALGASVAGAGDVNGDHISDLIVGAPGADWNGLTDSGSAYVIFGKSAPFPTHFNISKLRRGDGFRLDGARYGDHASAWVARAGDVNG